MYKVRHRVYATLEGKSLDKKLEELSEISGVGRYKNADHPGIRFPERAQFYLDKPSYTPDDVTTAIDKLEAHFPILQSGGVRKVILRWTILSNDPAYEVNTELGQSDLLRLANLNGSLAITFYAKAHL